MSEPLPVCRFAFFGSVSAASVLLGSNAADGRDVVGLPGKGMFFTLSIVGFFLCSCCRSLQVSKSANAQRLGLDCSVPAGVRASHAQVCRSRQHRARRGSKGMNSLIQLRFRAQACRVKMSFYAWATAARLRKATANRPLLSTQGVRRSLGEG